MNIRSLRQTAAGLLMATTIASALVGGTAAAETNVRLSLDSRIEGPVAPFLLALDKGYYKAQGLNVAIDPSAGPPEPIARVASGAYDIGFSDINALIKFRDANPKVPMMAVFMVYNRPPFAILGRRSRGIATPKDLEGKTIGAPAADIAYAQWPIFAQVNGIDTSKVTIEHVGLPVREPMLAAGQVDAITGRSFSAYVNLKAKGAPMNDIAVLLMADHGVALYGNAIFVNPKFAADHPDAVKGFLKAFTRALKETVRAPAAAIEPVLKRSDLASKDTETERLVMAIRDNIVTPEVKANGYGGIDEARFARAIDQLEIAYKFRNTKPKPGDIFDASFLPPDAERKAN